MIFVVTDISSFAGSRKWLADFGGVLVSWQDEDALRRDPPRTFCVTQYTDGRKVDFTLWPVELLQQFVTDRTLPDQLDVGYRVLLDKDGLTKGLQPATHRAHIPQRPSSHEFLLLIEDYFHETTYAAKHLWRDELMPAKFSLDYVTKQVDLRKMLEWRIEIDHD